MATNTDTAPSFKKIASLLGIEVDELSSLLKDEYKTISADPIESKRHLSNPTRFIEDALEQIDIFAANQNYLQVLKKIIHRDEPRKFYFYPSELEAISRILFVIENAGNFQLNLDNLDLYSLPPILQRTRNLQSLSISNNKLQDISLVASLPELQELIANDNQISDINFLQSNTKLQVLCLNRNNIKTTYKVLKTLPALRELELTGNRINDTLVKPVLENPHMEKVVLADNPINAPLNILNDIVALRTHFRITVDEPISGDTKDTSSVTGGLEATNPNEIQAQPVAENTTSEPNAPEPEQEQTVAAETNTAEPGPSINDDHPGSETEKATEEKQYVSYSIRDIRLRGNPDKTLLDVEKLSGIFYNLIANSDNNGEHFFGLFGRWGRGKTFFWKYILKNNLNPNKYIPIEFHAWKYQDTPGIWAYLYNVLNETYLGDKPKWYQLTKWAVYYKKLINLNDQRGKLSVIVGFIFSIAIAVGVYLYSDFIKAGNTVKTILGWGIPISIISMLIYIAKTFKTDARKIILSLTSNVNFNSQLGFQHEIQQELKYLLMAWLPDQKPKKKKNREQEKEKDDEQKKEDDRKRIFLFIDDIDRCSEDKIIQIVDYIRVLLHCTEIQDRVTVLAAIDERILLHAIQDKYKDFIENKDNDATYKELCREYMDKLFLAGLKLGPLTEFEKRQIVEGFTSMDTAAADVATPPAANGINANKVAEIISNTDSEEPEIAKQEAVTASGEAKVVIPEGGVPASEPDNKDIRQAKTETAAIPVAPKQITSTARTEFPYEKWEQEFIKDILARNTESTPRSIRVYTYRYLLGKQLVEKSLTEGKTSWSQWYNTKEAKQCFAIKLLHYGFKSDTEHLLSDYRNFISDYDHNRSVKESIYGYEISLNQELGSIMFQVLTMIIAY
jgi:hypothetical protein